MRVRKACARFPSYHPCAKTITTPAYTHAPTGAQGCRPEEEAPEYIFDDPQGYTNKTGRVGGEWISKLERYRHENHERRQEKKHPNGTGEHSSGGGGGHRTKRRAQRQRWLQRRERDGGRVGEEWVVRRGAQAEEEQQAGGVTHAPLGASFAEVCVVSIG